MAHELSLPTACRIFLDQGWNPCPLQWEADSYPLYHQGSPRTCVSNAFPGDAAAVGGLGTTL